MKEVECQYGPKEEWEKEKELNRMHDIYDTTFKDYDFIYDYEYRSGDYDACYIAFYLKDGRVVKIYLWRGLSD